MISQKKHWRRPGSFSSCRGKKKYRKKEAKQKVQERFNRTAVKYQAYRCSYCRFPDGSRCWHIGHPIHYK